MKIEFNTDNDAFTEDKPHECIRILQDICRRVALGDTQGTIRDINGNVIGSWKS